jgi:hypothetical protein
MLLRLVILRLKKYFGHVMFAESNGLSLDGNLFGLS